MLLKAIILSLSLLYMFLCWDEPALFIYFLVDEHLSCIQSEAMNILEHNLCRLYVHWNMQDHWATGRVHVWLKLMSYLVDI